MIIYIGNLPHDVYEDELVEMFEEYGACLLYTSPSPRD